MGIHNHPPVAFSAFLKRVRQLNLGSLAYQLKQSTPSSQWTNEQTLRAITRYLMFLYLVNQYPKLRLAPSTEIDLVWHYHILDTAQYAEDCQFLFGRFIHHYPFFGVQGEEDQQNLQLAYTLTQLLFQQHFGMTITATVADCEPLLGCAALNSMAGRVRPQEEVSIDALVTTLETHWAASTRD